MRKLNALYNAVFAIFVISSLVMVSCDRDDEAWDQQQ